MLILPDTDQAGAAAVGENVRARVENSDFVDQDGKLVGKVTVSGGVATFPGDGAMITDLIRSADQALYAAKAAGRNQIQLYKA